MRVQVLTPRRKTERDVSLRIYWRARKNLQVIPPLAAARLRELIGEAIRNSAVYDALVNQHGTLKTELGVIDPEGKEDLEQLIKILQASVKASKFYFQRRMNHFRAGFEITAIQSDYVDVLSAGIGSYEYENAKGEVNTIPWLLWLLKSTPPIITGYYIKFGQKGSRTGDAIMIRNPSSSWSLPTEFDPSKDDNFIVEALKKYGVIPTLTTFIKDQIQRRI